MTRAERKQIARRRLVRVLDTHTVAIFRTLEQKIADAGPYNQRVNPHIITEARNELIREARITRIFRELNTPWFHLHDADPDRVAERLAEQQLIHTAANQQAFTKRVGQALEIAVFRALISQRTMTSLDPRVDR
jgi:rRNA maturation protein Rpf1